jgi:hypothetical protein
MEPAEQKKAIAVAKQSGGAADRPRLFAKNGRAPA